MQGLGRGVGGSIGASQFKSLVNAATFLQKMQLFLVTGQEGPALRNDPMLRELARARVQKDNPQRLASREDAARKLPRDITEREWQKILVALMGEITDGCHYKHSQSFLHGMRFQASGNHLQLTIETNFHLTACQHAHKFSLHLHQSSVAGGLSSCTHCGVSWSPCRMGASINVGILHSSSMNCPMCIFCTAWLSSNSRLKVTPNGPGWTTQHNCVLQQPLEPPPWLRMWVCGPYVPCYPLTDS